MYTKKGQELLNALDPKQLQRERVLEQAAYLVFLTMADLGWSKADFARQLGTTRSHVSQVLRGTRNVGLGTLSDMLFTLGYKLTLEKTPLVAKQVFYAPDDIDKNV